MKYWLFYAGTGTVKTHWRTGTWGRTRSTSWAAPEGAGAPSGPL